RIRALFARDRSVIVPEIDYAHSSARVITMQLVAGIKVNDRAAIEAAGLDPEDVVAGVTSLWNQMIMGLGFFHAYPHPGNVLVQAADIGPRFVILDFGLAKQLPKGFGLGLFEMMFSMMTQNEAAMIRAFKELGFRTKTGDPASYQRIAREMMRSAERGDSRGELTEEMTDELMESIRKDPIVQVPSDVVLVARALSLLSGIAHTLGGRANTLDALGGGPRS